MACLPYWLVKKLFFSSIGFEFDQKKIELLFTKNNKDILN